MSKKYLIFAAVAVVAAVVVFQGIAGAEKAKCVPVKVGQDADAGAGCALAGGPSGGSRPAYPSVWDDFDRLHQRMMNMFAGDDFFGPFAGGTGFGRGYRQRTRAPYMDMVETPDEVVVTVDVPGIEKDALDIEIERGVLTVRGESTVERSSSGDEEGESQYYYRERRAGSFSRSIALPEIADAAGATAKHENGVLTIRFPKTEASKAVKVAIQ